MRHGQNGYVEISPGEFVRAAYTVEDMHRNAVVRQTFRSYGAAREAMKEYLAAHPDASADTRVYLDYEEI